MSRTNGLLLSRGLHEYKRIGRPDVYYDMRTSYAMNGEEFDRTMNERKKIGFGAGPSDDIAVIETLIDADD